MRDNKNIGLKIWKNIRIEVIIHCYNNIYHTLCQYIQLLISVSCILLVNFLVDFLFFNYFLLYCFSSFLFIYTECVQRYKPISKKKTKFRKLYSFGYRKSTVHYTNLNKQNFEICQTLTLYISKKLNRFGTKSSLENHQLPPKIQMR